MQRAAHHIATTQMTDILTRMWDVLYNCDSELRTTRPTDPRHINQEINSLIHKTFGKKMTSKEFLALEGELGSVIALRGEGISQYAISRAMAHVLDQAGTQDCNARFIREADKTLASVANRKLSECIPDKDTLKILGRQAENQWKGRLANGLRPPIVTHQILMGASLAIGAGLLFKGLDDFRPKAPESTSQSDLPEHSYTTQSILAAAEVAAGIGVAKWTLTGRILPGIHKIRALG